MLPSGDNAMHDSKTFLAERVQAILQNLSKATMWSKMTEYVGNLKRREQQQKALSKYGKHIRKLLQGKNWLLESTSTI